VMFCIRDTVSLCSRVVLSLSYDEPPSGSTRKPKKLRIVSIFYCYAEEMGADVINFVYTFERRLSVMRRCSFFEGCTTLCGPADEKMSSLLCGGCSFFVVVTQRVVLTHFVDGLRTETLCYAEMFFFRTLCYAEFDLRLSVMRRCSFFVLVHKGGSTWSIFDLRLSGYIRVSFFERSLLFQRLVALRAAMSWECL
jgi:hypothetical protein